MEQNNPAIKEVLKNIKISKDKHNLEKAIISSNINEKHIKGITAHKSQNHISSLLKRIRESVRFKDEEINTITLKLKVMRWAIFMFQILLAASMPALFVLSKVPPLLTATWRFSMGLIVMTPLVAYEIFSGNYLHIYCISNLFNLQLQIKTFITSVFFCGWGSLILISYNYGPVLQMNIFNNLQIVVIFLLMVYLGVKFPNYGYYGFLFFFFGLILILNDDSIKSNRGKDFYNVSFFEKYVLGYSLAMFTSICAAFYYTMANKISKLYTVNSLSYFMAIYIIIILCPATIFFEGTELSFSPNNGLLGLFAWENLQLFILIGTFGIGVLILSSYILSIFDPFIVNAMQVMKPLLSCYIVAFLGIQTYPGYQNLIGCAFAFIGLLSLLFAQVFSIEKLNTEEIQVDEKELRFTDNKFTHTISSFIKESGHDRGSSERSGYYYSMI